MSELRYRVEVTVGGVSVISGVGSIEPGLFNFEIEQGASLSLPMNWYDGDPAEIKDLTGYTATLTSTHLALTQASGLTLGTTPPNVTVTRTAAQTAALSGWLREPYDLLLTAADGTARRLLSGFVTLRKKAA